MAKGRATRGWPGPSGCCGGTEVRCTAEGSVQVQEGLHDLDGVLVVDLVRTVLVGTDLVLEAGHRLGTDLAVLLGADPDLQSQHGGLVQLTGLLDVQPVLQGGDGVGAHLAVDLEGAGDGQPAGGLRAGLLGTLLGRLALIGVLGLRCLALRSEEHTSELQSRGHLVCRLLLEKKKYSFSDLVAERQVTGLVTTSTTS